VPNIDVKRQLDQNLLSGHTYRHTDTPIVPTALPGPLKWSEMTSRPAFARHEVEHVQ